MRSSRSSEKSGSRVFTRASSHLLYVYTTLPFTLYLTDFLWLGHVRIHERPRVFIIQVLHEGSAR